MTIKPGEPGARLWTALDRSTVVADDAALGRWLAAGGAGPVRVGAGDLVRTVGGVSTGRRVSPLSDRHAAGRPRRRRARRTDRGRARRRASTRSLGWWRGPLWAAMNVSRLRVLGRRASGSSQRRPGRRRSVDADMRVAGAAQAARRLPSGTHLPHPAITDHASRARHWDGSQPATVYLDGEPSARARHVRGHGAARRRRRARADHPIGRGIGTRRIVRRERLRPRAVHCRGSGDAPAVLHQPRRTRLCPGEPARGGEGRTVRPLQPQPEEPASTLPRRVRRRPRRGRRRDHRRHHRSEAGRGSVREGLSRVRRRLGRAARRRPPGVRAGLEHPDQGAGVGSADELPRAEHPLHRLRRSARGPLPIPPGPSRAGQPERHSLRRRHGPHVRRVQRGAGGRDRARAGHRGPRPARQRLRVPPSDPGQGAWMRCAGCCRRRRCPTSGSTPAVRRSRRCCCGCAATRCRRPASTPR